MINPDQMRADYMTPNGHPFINTRQLSRLASMGTNFKNTFVSCPMCGPSRTSVVTGRYPSEQGCRNYGGRMHPDYLNLFRSLKEAGYHRALFGNDHIMAGDAIGIFYDEGEDICIGNMDKHPDYARSWSSGSLDQDSPWNLTVRLTTAGLDYIVEDPDHAAVIGELTERLMARMMNHGQAPEHLPRPGAVGVDADGLPVWHQNYDHIELCDGYRP